MCPYMLSNEFVFVLLNMIVIIYYEITDYKNQFSYIIFRDVKELFRLALNIGSKLSKGLPLG